MDFYVSAVNDDGSNGVSTCLKDDASGRMAMFLTNVFLMPYMALRLEEPSRSESANCAQVKEP